MNQNIDGNFLRRHQAIAIWLAGLLSTTAFLGLILCGVNNNVEQFKDVRKQQNPDARQYVQLASNMILKGKYSRHPCADSEPDILRTPIYPLFIIVTGCLTHPLNLYAIQYLMVILSIVLTFRMANRISSKFAGTIAALVALTDLLLLNSCFEAMSEVLFMTLTMLSLEILQWPRNKTSTNQSKARLIFGGCFLGLSTLTRPSNLYLPIVLILCSLFYLRDRSSAVKQLKHSLIIVLGFAVVVMPWVIRNQTTFGIPKLTTIDKHNLIYFVAAGALQAKHGWDRQTAQKHIESQYQIPSYTILQNPWSDPDGRTTKQLYDTIDKKALSIALHEPTMLIYSSLVGVVKASLAHCTTSIAEITGSHWNSVRRFRQNTLGMNLVFILQQLHTLAYLSCTSLGIYWILRKKLISPQILCLLAILAYYFLIIAMFGIDAVARARISCLPFLYVLTGLGCDMLLHKSTPDRCFQ